MGFVDAVKAAYAANRDIRNVWHPEPLHPIIHTENGNLNVFVGERKAQLTTGDFIEI